MHWVTEFGITTDACRGFRDARTAELLLQRARRLENSSVQKKKFSQLGQYSRVVSLILLCFHCTVECMWCLWNADILFEYWMELMLIIRLSLVFTWLYVISDPKQRIAMFRKLEEMSRVRPVVQPKQQRAHLNCFKGKKVGLNVISMWLIHAVTFCAAYLLCSLNNLWKWKK